MSLMDMNFHREGLLNQLMMSGIYWFVETTINQKLIENFHSRSEFELS